MKAKTSNRMQQKTIGNGAASMIGTAVCQYMLFEP